MSFKAGLGRTIILVSLLSVAGLAWFLFWPTYPRGEVATQSDITRRTIAVYSGAVDRFRQDMGRYPSPAIGLTELFENVEEDANWEGPYLGRIHDPADGWNRKIVYNTPAVCSSDRGFDLYSMGKNGIDECMQGDDVYEGKNDKLGHP